MGALKKKNKRCYTVLLRVGSPINKNTSGSLRAPSDGFTVAELQWRALNLWLAMRAVSSSKCSFSNQRRLLHSRRSRLKPSVHLVSCLLSLLALFYLETLRR